MTTASTMLDKINAQIDHVQHVALNGLANVHHAEIQALQQRSKDLMKIIATEGDRALSEEEEIQLNWPKQ